MRMVSFWGMMLKIGFSARNRRKCPQVANTLYNLKSFAGASVHLKYTIHTIKDTGAS